MSGIAHVGLSDAEKRFSELVERVMQDEPIMITKRGAPVALCVPFDPPEKMDVVEAGDRLRKLRESISPGGVTSGGSHNEGHRP